MNEIDSCIEELKILAKHYKVKVYYSKNLKWAQGLAHKNSFTVSLYNTNPERLISTFFHELGHIDCKRNGKWKVFHTNDRTQIQKFRRTAFKAELWIDKWAEKEMKKWKPNMNYVDSYIHLPRSQAKRWFDQNILNKHWKLN